MKKQAVDNAPVGAINLAEVQAIENELTDLLEEQGMEPNAIASFFEFIHEPTVDNTLTQSPILDELMKNSDIKPTLENLKSKIC